MTPLSREQIIQAVVASETAHGGDAAGQAAREWLAQRMDEPGWLRLEDFAAEIHAIGFAEGKLLRF